MSTVAAETRQQHTESSNAVELPSQPLSMFLLQIFRNHDERPIREALNELFTAEPMLARVIGNAYLNWESTKAIREAKRGNATELPANVMLHMVGSLNREQQRDLLKDGLEHATGIPVKFKTTKTPEN